MSQPASDATATVADSGGVGGIAAPGENPSIATAPGVVTDQQDATAGPNGVPDDTQPDKPAWFHKACKDVLPPASLNSPDILLDQVHRLGQRGLTIQKGPDKTPAVFINRDNLWNGTPQQLRYWFIDGNEVQKRKVRTVIDEWTWYANIAFEEAHSAAQSNIRIKFDPNDGSWSYVGRQCDDIPVTEPTMNLAWVDKFSELSLTDSAVIKHEFGHAIGLLHEHQSPSHGGVAIRNIQAAIDLYTKGQGWSVQQVYDQVINVYKLSDVSNFSQVDTRSIMHYPQPKELTGLKQDIPYNMNLSDLDKAYAMLQYPRQTVHPRAAKEGWSFDKALDIMGVTDEVREEVLGFLQTDRDQSTGEISPANIRIAIEDWSRDAHASAANGSLLGTAQGPAHTTEVVEQYGQVTVDVDDEYDLCAVDAGDESGGTKPAHAVSDESILWPLPADGVLEPLVITYTIRAEKEDGTKVEVTSWQDKLVKKATATWATFAAVSFVPAQPGTAVDVVIRFNNQTNPDPEGGDRSTCLMVSGINKSKRKLDLKRKKWDSLTPDIQYRGIFADEDDAKKYKSRRFKSSQGSVAGTVLAFRSTAHELGHQLGLRHESTGLYGHWLHSTFNPSENDLLKEITANKYWATRYDAGSIMDTIGLRLEDVELEILRLKGLQQASVRRVRDKTTGRVFSRVNISLTLSPYDQANIALLYPGSNLVDAAGSGLFTLRPSTSKPSQSLVGFYLESLKLDSQANVDSITTALRAGKWQAAREAYLNAVAEAQKKEASSLQQWKAFIADKIEVTSSGTQGVFDVMLKSDYALSKPSHGIAPGGHDPAYMIPVPAHDVSNPTHNTDDRPVEPVAISDGPGSFIYELYKKLGTLYCPGGGQYLALQFPTRFLDKETYAYKLDGYFSRFEKPVVVNEAEFLLTDALYPIAPIVGGPNGQSLSKNYSKALNSLIPTFEPADVRKQREKMRAWLMKETKEGNAAFTVDTRLSMPGIDAATARELSLETGMTITPGQSTADTPTDQTVVKNMALQAINVIKSNAMSDPRGMTRMEYSDSLMQAYLNDRKAWELRKDDMINEASAAAATDPLSMEKLTRKLAHITAIEEAKLGSKYADAVVRGYSHTVRGLMGHLDIKSTAESLQDAKDALRESALSSVYSASQVYPVAMQPADWFQALDTGFTREDLAQDPDLVKASVQAKSQLIDNLETQIANLRGFNKGDAAIAKKAMEEAAAKRETALANLSRKYTSSTISAVKLAIQVAATSTPVGAAVTAASSSIEAMLEKPDDPATKGLTNIFGGDSNALTDIASQIDAVAQANAEVNAASRVLTEAMSERASALAGDTQTMVENLQRQLTRAKAELADLQESYTIACRAPDTSDADLAAIGRLPSGNGGSRWSEVHISTTVKNDYTDAESMASSSVSSSSCNFWIGSSSSSSSSASATNTSKSLSATLGVDVAMRTTYVTVDRSGWFDPSFFDMSEAFMHGADDTNYVAWSHWKAEQTIKQAAASIRDNDTEMPSGYLAAFPVGYILVKDVVIKITTASAKTEDFKSHFDKDSESSGGFLCFSHSSASRSSGDSSASTSKDARGGIVVRIPGPQILGYIMQLTGLDKSQTFKAMSADELFLEDPDVLDSSPGISKPTNPDALRTTNPDLFKPSHATGPPASTGPSPSTGFSPATGSSPSTGPPPFTNPSPSTDIPTNSRKPKIRSYDQTRISTSDQSSTSDKSAGRAITEPAHGVSPPAVKPPSHLIDALRTALSDAEVTNWLSSQPGTTKDDLLATITAALGKAAKST